VVTCRGVDDGLDHPPPHSGFPQGFIVPSVMKSAMKKTGIEIGSGGMSGVMGRMPWRGREEIPLACR
jgi:hypothetical protein